jgi:uncharacterized DUF497 family protein
LEGSSVAFSWDEANVRHLARHNVTPEEAEQCYRNDPLIVEEQYESGEERFLALGENHAARRPAFVFTIRGDKVRFVTAYPMTRDQQQEFEEG